MPNMSYCRFGNTLGDLRECQDALANGDFEDMSESELKAAIKLVERCTMIAADADSYFEALKEALDG